MNTRENKKKIWNKYIYRKSASFSYYQSQAYDGFDLTSIKLNKFLSFGGGVMGPFGSPVKPMDPFLNNILIHKIKYRFTNETQHIKAQLLKHYKKKWYSNMGFMIYALNNYT